MKLTQSMESQAKEALTQGRPSSVPDKVRIPLSDMSSDATIFVAQADDEEIFPLGVVEHNGVEYQVGPIKDASKK